MMYVFPLVSYVHASGSTLIGTQAFSLLTFSLASGILTTCPIRPYHLILLAAIKFIILNTYRLYVRYRQVGHLHF